MMDEGTHGCGCGHDHDHEHDHEQKMIYVTLEDGKEVACLVVDMFEVEDKEYIAIVPEGEQEVFLYRFKEDENGLQLINIEDDGEFELVSQTFLESIDMVDEEEEIEEEIEE